MAIYHLSAKVISRAAGQSVVASAAYRAAELLHDRRLERSFDYERKSGVAHTEILAPEGAPSWVSDRQALWNEVEASRLARMRSLLERSRLPCRWSLILTSRSSSPAHLRKRRSSRTGMVVDLAIHTDNPENPHAHLLLTTREITPEGFGAKRRDWNAKEQLLEWRERWAASPTSTCAAQDLTLRSIIARSKIRTSIFYPGGRSESRASASSAEDLPPNVQDRIREQREIAAENGRRILVAPQIALSALTHHQATFTERDIAKYLHTRTDGLEQFQAALLKVTTSPELVAVGKR